MSWPTIQASDLIEQIKNNISINLNNHIIEGDLILENQTISSTICINESIFTGLISFKYSVFEKSLDLYVKPPKIGPPFKL